MLGIVVLIYKSHDLVLSYVRRELARVSLPHKTLIVDVGSPRAHAEELAAELAAPLADSDEADLPPGDLFVLHQAENLGYARGNNAGARLLLRNFPGLDKLLFSNDDIELLSPNVLEVLAAKLDAHPEVGCIGPRVVDLQDALCPPLYHRPNIWYFVKRNLGEPLLGAARFLERRPEGYSEGPCEVVSGCFHLVRVSSFVEAGMFDPRTFLYWEEQILSARLRQVGQQVYFTPEVSVRHFVGNTTSRHVPNLLLVNCELEGQRIYFGSVARAGWFARACLAFSGLARRFLVRLAIWRRRLLRRR